MTEFESCEDSSFFDSCQEPGTSFADASHEVVALEFSFDTAHRTRSHRVTHQPPGPRHHSVGTAWDVGVILLTPLIVAGEVLKRALFGFRGIVVGIGLLGKFVVQRSVGDEDVRRRRRMVIDASFFVAMLVYSMFYGARTAYDVCGYDQTCVEESPIFSSMLALSKTAAKLFLALYSVLIFVVLKPTVNFLEETKVNKFVSVPSWRIAHVSMYFFALFFAAVHVGGHIVRVAYGERPIVVLYELYELWTGVILTALFLFMALPYFLIRKTLSRNGSPRAKALFRSTHHIAFYLISFVLCFHAWQVTPALFFLIYVFQFQHSRLPIVVARYRVLQDHKYIDAGRADPDRQHVVELVFRVDSVVPQGFGFYTTVRWATEMGTALFSNYTTIALSEKLFMVCIGSSTLSRALLGGFRSDNPDVDRHVFDAEADRFIVNNDVGTWRTVQQLDRCRVFGFFRSFDMSFGNKKNLICFVAGTGRVVSDAVLTFHRNFRSYDSVTIVHETRNTYSDYSSILADAADVEGHEDAYVQHLNMLETTRVAPAVTLAEEIANHVKACEAILEATEEEHPAARVCVCNVKGMLKSSDVHELLTRMLRMKGASDLEVLVVSGRLQTVVEEAFEEGSLDKNMLHVEEFGLD